MDAAAVATVITAAAGLVGAVTALIVALRHQADTGAHGGRGHPPA